MDPKSNVLSFEFVANIINSMGFLPDKLTDEHEKLMDDIYKVFKCEKENEIYAENLQNLLLVISGDRDIENEVVNDILNKKWSNAGVYDEETGLFYIR
jgi:hypothetical protein